MTYLLRDGTSQAAAGSHELHILKDWTKDSLKLIHLSAYRAILCCNALGLCRVE